MFSAKKILSAVVAGFMATGAMAQENLFVGGTLGQTSSNYSESSRAHAMMSGVDFDGIIDDSGAWGIRFGNDQTHSRYYLSYDYVSDSYRSLASIRQQTLGASYDLMLPVGAVRFFGGASAGVSHVKQNSNGFRNDTEWGLYAGLQAGALLNIAPDVDLEAGYRYAKHDGVDLRFKSKSGIHSGSADLKSTEQFYLGVNWRF